MIWISEQRQIKEIITLNEDTVSRNKTYLAFLEEEERRIIVVCVYVCYRLQEQNPDFSLTNASAKILCHGNLEVRQ